jgi:hypothetical protein
MIAFSIFLYNSTRLFVPVEKYQDKVTFFGVLLHKPEQANEWRAKLQQTEAVDE